MKALPTANHCTRAQLSLEYLVLLAAFFSVLLMLIPLVQKTFALAQFGFDARQAQAFARQFKETARLLGLLSEESAFAIEISPLLEWNIKTHGNKLSVSLYSEALDKNKAIEAELSLQASDFEKTFSESAVITLKKSNGLLVLDSNS